MTIQNDEVILNISLIRKRFVDLGLKQWWVAEQIGVDRKTVSRWLQGKVKAVRRENAALLAKVIQEELSAIIIQDETEQFATANDQKEAAEMLTSSSFLNTLAPIGEWEVVEKLLKANLIPNLPLQTLAKMYSELSVACWRQSKIDSAKVYAEKALELAEKIQELPIIVGAKLSLANIASWRGDLKKSIDMYQFCVENGKFLESQKMRATAYSNLGAVYGEAGEFEHAISYQKLALEIYQDIGEGMNLSIANGHLAMLSLEKGDIDHAQSYALESLEWAKKANYRRGIQMETLTLAEIHAVKKEKEPAMDKLHKSLQGFKKLGIEEGFNYTIAGRIYRLFKDYKKRKQC